MTKKTIFIVSFIYFFLSLNSQAGSLDTLRLYRDKCGMRYNVYKWNLFLVKSKQTYSYNPRTVQDSIIDNYQKDSSYCIFFDRKKRKMYEGPLYYGYFKGVVLFYYKSGQIKKAEIYDTDTVKYGNSTFAWTDAPYETGCWKYYKKSGRLFKQKEFLTLSKNDNDKIWLYRISILSQVDNKGNIETKQTKLLNRFYE